MKKISLQPHTCFLLLGANLGERKKNITQAKALITKHCGYIIIESSIYETAAWGVTNQPSFLNQVIQITTTLSPQKLILQLLAIEKLLGRERIIKMSARTIDIDILFIDNLTINNNNLIVPHPRIQDRKFVLIPLNEIAPTFFHTVLQKNINELLRLCTDNLDVKKFY